MVEFRAQDRLIAFSRVGYWVAFSFFLPIVAAVLLVLGIDSLVLVWVFIVGIFLCLVFAHRELGFVVSAFVSAF